MIQPLSLKQNLSLASMEIMQDVVLCHMPTLAEVEEITSKGFVDTWRTADALSDFHEDAFRFLLSYCLSLAISMCLFQLHECP